MLPTAAIDPPPGLGTDPSLEPVALEPAAEEPTIVPTLVPNQEIQETMSERKAQKALTKIIARLDDEENLENLHLKHDHMSTLQFKKRTSHLTLPSKTYETFDRVVKKCKFCNEQLPKPLRNRVSGLRAENLVDLIFMDHGTIKIHGDTHAFLLILDATTSYLVAYPSTSTGTDEVIKHLDGHISGNTENNLCRYGFSQPAQPEGFLSFAQHQTNALWTSYAVAKQN